MMRTHFTSAILLIAAYLGAAAALGYGSYYHIKSQSPLFEQKELLYVPGGSALSNIATALVKNGQARNEWHVKLVARIEGFDRLLQAGEYKLLLSESLERSLVRMAKGDVFLRKLAIPEGYSSAEIDNLIRSTPGLDLTGYTKPDEGSVLPETYFYVRGEKASDLIVRMHAKMIEAIEDLWEHRYYDLPLKTPEEALILASIVEKETAIASERPLVAAVFINRLRKKMRLQSDPTTIYGITGGLPLGRGLRKSELRAQTPYNTYKIKGLPSGPITNPGIDSIRAVLHPADVDYLYFVADGAGGHAFSTNLRDHNKNVAKWRAQMN